jgi:hypothetical protein
MKAVNEEYIGDGLYVSFDGWSIWLRAPRTGGDHYVALDQLMMRDLIAYCERQGWKTKTG